MKKMIRTTLIAGVSLLIAGASVAQQVEMPPFMKDLEGVTYQGQASGMDLYSMEGFDGLWLVSPDGRTAIAGTIFSADGRDVGSAFSGKPAVTIFQSDQGSASVSSVVPGQVGDASKVLSEEELSRMEEGVSRIEEDVFGSSPEVGAKKETPAESSGSADEATKSAHEALEGFSAQDKEILMAALVALLKDVKSETEFKAAVKLWTEEIVRRHESKGAVSDQSSLPLAVTPEKIVADAPLTPPAEALAQEAEASMADTLLAEMRTDAFWFGVGNHEAPVVYAFIDPTCPYCSKAIVNLGDEVSEGRLQLRIALAPVVNKSAPGYISAILQHEEPPIAFMEHEYSWASGRSPLKPGNWDDLPGAMRDGLLHNVEIMKKYEIQGVPFFIFNTEDGARVISGIPTPEAVSTAIRDDFQGSH